MAAAIKAILVDDEAICIENLAHYLNLYCPLIEIVGTATTIDAATQLMATEAVDLAFLDVQLLNETTLDMLPVFQDAGCAIVFVTAYEQYALKAFQASAIDYILKPILADEIRRCYEKVLRFCNPTAEPDAGQPQHVTIRDAGNIFKLPAENILFLSASGIYTRVHFEHGGIERNVLITKSINVLLQLWAIPGLMRVHRSYAVNTDRISGIRKAGAIVHVRIGALEIPVAKRRSTEFLRNYQPRCA